MARNRNTEDRTTRVRVKAWTAVCALEVWMLKEEERGGGGGKEGEEEEERKKKRREDEEEGGATVSAAEAEVTEEGK